MLEGLVGALIGALLTSIGTFIGLRFQYRDMYARNVSTSRMDWINNFREEVGVIVACLKMLSSQTKCETAKVQSCPTKYEAEKARARLLTRLNMDTSKLGNEYNEVFADCLNGIKFDGSDDEHISDKLIDLTRKILEPEWKRVKKEAGGWRNT